MATYAVKQLEISVKDSGGSGDGVAVKDLETLDISLNSNVEQYTTIGEVFERAVKTGAAMELGLDGKYNESDPGQNELRETWDKVGAEAEKTIVIKFPAGSKYEITGPIGINDFGGGGANDIGSFSATQNSNGTPVFTPAPTIEPTSVTVDSASKNVKVGETIKITAGVLPSGAPQTVTFTSSDETKATVASDGTVTGVETTTTAIKVTVASTVKPSVKNEVSVSVTPA
ncbi:Ig domain-containing protein [Listeria monocytogenes]|uniref:phage tail tube protein n=1 Tax=Listeria monocytogenes TaxID=1639 RepID=UPI0004788CBF|nr:Ig-like domain-containing protein [Listeria monocytogenes]EAD3300098.1 Ig domain-containing protein [Listeria monocytogenes]EAD8954790.1 Ig domain-containing protein [Listeria monocytogenes]EAD9535537.1 Ig domain-containing protein [Listeria monocytogenes]EAF2427726.1 Ig domain-containing protein [Listeria monocytogenes]EAF4980259.1 Ig domain-containing protein [Listeria monocytogenes]